MHPAIYLKLMGGTLGDAFSPPVAALALGDHGCHSHDGVITDLLTTHCHSFDELQEQAAYLKKLIDNAVRTAKGKLP